MAAWMVFLVVCEVAMIPAHFLPGVFACAGLALYSMGRFLGLTSQ